MTAAPAASRTVPPSGVPSARQLRSRLRRARRRHHPPSLGDLLTDIYMAVLFTAMYGWAFVSNVREYLHSPSADPADPAERYWLAGAALLAVAGLGWQGLRALGPVLVTPATQAWAVSAPVDRRAWLLPRAGLLIGLAAGAGALLGAALGAVGTALVDRADLGLAALAGAACGAAGVGLSIVAQGSLPGRRWPRLLGTGATVAGALGAVTVVVAHFTGLGLVRPSVPVAGLVVVVALPLAVLTGALALRALPRVDRASLTTGAQFANAAATAAVLLDPSLLFGLVESRRWRGVGRVRSRRFLAGRRWWVLLQAEARRLRRHPSAPTAWVALVLLQYAVAVAVPVAAGTAQVVGAFLAAGRLAGGLRAVSRSPGLRRVLGGDDTAVRLVHLVWPAVGAALWWVVTLPVGGAQPGWLTVVLVLGVVAGAYRAATKPPMSYDTAMVDTPFGMIPVGLLSQLLRGWDVVAVVVVARLLLT
ncbi:DUF6297 family protein [Micromonospora yangpuensis]|uniref:ABC-2 type transport system permease protein n=1 Tax=Micromonospora yangpuensis TaxID=683228 RepID=A0A1C6VHF5_9ACTN|nr:DUF6297 family protein [Micromonospora yangpuensis]GGM32299.1 hypothetical protein GCM10012279_59050 [Micromonospora yangpuensis]SCL65320.1 hypothetical protein GA0070617_5730 [Micromonospora yangpuensis]